MSRMTGLLLISLFLLPYSQVLFTPSEASNDKDCGISVYWGQNEDEGSLKDICSVTKPVYKYISIGFVDTFGSGRTPVLNLDGHCSPTTGDCKKLAHEIKLCQRKSVKVLLSLGGPWGEYALNSQQDAQQLASDLYYNYLAAGSGGPLGDVVLDGVDMDIQNPRTTRHWDSLVRALSDFTKPDGDPLVISAGAGCSYPDPNLDAAIKTGLIDLLWVKFYDNEQCDMETDVRGILDAWNTWRDSIPGKTKLFMGLPASTDAAETRYVEANTLVNKILPSLQK